MLNKLPLPVLTEVVQELGPQDIARLESTSRHFRFEITPPVWDSIAWRPHRIASKFTWESPDAQSLSNRERYVSAYKWSHGDHKARTLRRFYRRQMPCVRLDPNGGGVLFCSESGIERIVLKRVRRRRRNNYPSFYTTSDDATNNNHDLSRFAVSDTLIAAGKQTIGETNGIYLWNVRGVVTSPSFRPDCHQCAIHSVDLCSSNGGVPLALSASRDGTAKVWRIYAADRRRHSLHLHRTVHIQDRVWCARFSPSAARFGAGCASRMLDAERRRSVRLFDVESGGVIEVGERQCGYGDGVCDLVWESETVMATVGYDKTLRLWDVRENTCVWKWEEPFNNSLYCLETDKSNSIIVGSQRHSLVWILDKRMTNKHLKFIYTDRQNSPVYATAFLTHSIFTALSNGLRVVSVL